MNSTNSAYAWQIVTIVISTISLIISQFSTIPQLIALKKTRNSSGISLLTYIIFVVTSVFWSAWSYMFYYGQMCAGAKAGVPEGMHQWGMIPTVIMNNANLLIMTTVLIIKLRHLSLCKKYHVDELGLSHILLSKDLNSCKSFGKVSNFKRYLPQIIILTAFAIILGLTTYFLVAFWTPETGTEAPGWLGALTMVFNGIGAVTWEAVSWPQFIKSMREKDTTGISLAWAIFLPVSCTILFFSDLLQGLSGGDGFDLGILFSLIFNGMISSYAVLILKLRNLKHAKKMKLSEEEYTKKYLIPLAKQKAAERAAKRAQKKNSH